MSTFPLVHLNGTSGLQLEGQYEAAGMALQEFIRAWDAIEFNQRDYYVLPGDAWTQAKKDREAHNAHIKGLRDYLLAHYNNLEEQNEARRGR